MGSAFDRFEDIYDKYKENMQLENIMYKKTFLGIIDILGFKVFLDNYKEKAPIEIFRLITENLFSTELYFNNLKFKMLSDTLIVYSEQIDDPSIILDIIFALDTFRTDMIRRGFFSRGAIVSGDNFIDGDIMISPAFIEAYIIEEKECIYPRIIINDDLVQKINDNIDAIIENYIKMNYDDDILRNTSIYNRYCNNMKVILRKIICRDDDSKYIIYPFIGTNDEIALYYFDDYIYNPTCLLNDQKMMMINKLMATLSGIKNGINSGYDRAKDDKSRTKANYLIKSFNDLINDLSIDKGSKDKLTI